MDEEKIGSSYDPGIWISKDPDDDEYAAVWYHQHCQPQGFPILKKIADHYGTEVEYYDGGSMDSYEAWLNGEELE